jgi:hypothetical protein
MTTFQLTNPKTYNVMDNTISQTKCDIMYDPDGHMKYDGFKGAIFGHTSIPILDPCGRVCIKQCWYTDSLDKLSTRCHTVKLFHSKNMRFEPFLLHF